MNRLVVPGVVEMEKSRAPIGETKGYDPASFEVLAEVEERHFWFRSRNQVIAGVVRTLAEEFGPGLRLLEVGCGTGNVLRALRETCPQATIVGLDLFPESLKFAGRHCGCKLVPGDILKHPFLANSFELVGMFDVLEHLADDGKALRSLHSLLIPGGALVLTVPAGPGLWSYFNEVGGHYGRYRANELITRLEENGFAVSYATHFMMTILPLVWIGRRLKRRRRDSSAESGAQPLEQVMSEFKVRPLINGWLRFLLRWESWWIGKGGRLPLGSSLLIVARKAATPH